MALDLGFAEAVVGFAAVAAAAIAASAGFLFFWNPAIISAIMLLGLLGAFLFAVDRSVPAGFLGDFLRGLGGWDLHPVWPNRIRCWIRSSGREKKKKKEKELLFCEEMEKMQL